MRFERRSTVVVLLLLSATGAAAAAERERVLFEEPFAGKLSPGWTFLREDAEDWRFRGGGLQMRAQPGRVWAGDGAENVLLRQPPGAEGPIAAGVTVSGRASEKYEQAGLLLYVDGTHFVKLVREHIDGTWYIVMAVESGGHRKVLAKREVSEVPKRLRLRIDERRIRGRWREPKQQDWHDAGSTTFPPDGEKPAQERTPRIGLFTQDGPADQVHWVTFRAFRIIRPNPE